MTLLDMIAQAKERLVWLEADVRAVYDALAQIEWVQGPLCWYCPVCRAERRMEYIGNAALTHTGHAPDCALASILIRDSAHKTEK